jgi:hypothetical protein
MSMHSVMAATIRLERIARGAGAALLVLLTSLAAAPNIVCPPTAPPQVKLAAKEIRRYVWLRTGELLPIAARGHGITLTVDPALATQQYRLRSDGDAFAISGGSEVAVLYGAYAFVEKLGVRFEISGDVIPDGKIPFRLPALDETRRPLFELRGLQPFHDFPEGPDWWTQDDWRLFVGQAVKMRMNFIGLHTYPFHNRNLGPEPTVWVGLPEEVNADGTVRVADHASWYTTAKPMPYGCYAPGKTGDYSFGAAQVFPTDDYGPEINAPDDFPMPKTPAAKAALINHTGAMLRTVFTEARELGVKIAVGTESPLDIPDGVKAALVQRGLDPDAPATLRLLYAGMFTRIQRAFPVDTYWIWGHEGDIDEKRFVTNLTAAREALQDLGSPFGLGICGWGWTAGHFPALDQALPKDIAFSAISMSLGRERVSENFAGLAGRQKWAIPWFEDDDALASLQLRAGRMRRDAVDARRYGCNGLMGLHWRTRIIAPNINALAQAGWEQGEWSQASAQPEERRDVQVLGGKTAAFLNHKVSGTDVPSIYQTVRFALRGYHFAVPDGNYRVTLRFVEPAFQQAGKRVFGVKLQGQPVVEHLDVFARVGQFAALDLAFLDVAVTQGELKIDFVPEVEFPCIAAIEVVGANAARKINCGGLEYQDFAADANPENLPRDLPVGDFYADWAEAQFGPEAGAAAAAIFARLDGNFPKTSGWTRGPGAMVINKQPWAQLAPRFAFVDDFAALRSRIRGQGHRERFDWWLNTFRVTKFMGEFGCVRGDLDAIMKRIAAGKDASVQLRQAREEALPVRLRMVALLRELHHALLATLNNATELGTLCNIEQQSLLRLKVLTAHDAALAGYLGETLPAAAHPGKDYRGDPRFVVMTARTAARKGEVLTLRIIALDQQPVKSVTVHLRPLGKGEWTTSPATHIARAVYEVKLPAAQEDFEYYVAAGDTLAWPATAPQRNQTVVIMD